MSSHRITILQKVMSCIIMILVISLPRIYKNWRKEQAFQKKMTKLTRDWKADKKEREKFDQLVREGDAIRAKQYDEAHSTRDVEKKSSEVTATAEKAVGWQDANFKTFSTNGHPKAKGARFSIEMPIPWKWQEGRHPNVVHFFSSDIRDGIALQAGITIKKASKLKRGAFAELTADDCADPQFIKLFLSQDMKCVRSGMTKLDGEPVLWIEASMQTERSHIKVSTYDIHYVIPDDGRLIHIALGISQMGYQPDPQTIFDQHRSLFQRIISSFVMTSKWE